jgi:hypothetical protein
MTKNLNLLDDPTETHDFEEFESINLEKCLDYFKDYKDIEPLENAILENRWKIERAIENIQLLIDVARSTKNSYMANQLIGIQTSLSKDL